MKILIDVSLSFRWAARLRDAGFKADSWADLGANNAPDLEIISFARDSGSVILTRDLDFGAHMALNRAAQPSVIQLRAEIASPEAVGDSVIAALRGIALDLEQGVLVTIDLNRTRITLLPFGSASPSDRTK